MQIQNINETNFRGGYKFIRMPKAAREELVNVIPKGKVIYDAFEGKKGNVFLVTRDNYHTRVAGLVQKYQLRCKYYPEINTEMGLITGHPEKAIEMLKYTQGVDFVLDKDMQDKVAEMDRIQYAKKNCEKYTSNILNALKLDMDETSLKINYGARTFLNKNHTKEISISAPDKNRVHYVRVKPTKSDSSHSLIGLYSMNSMGDILHDYTREIDSWPLFNRNFNATCIK